MFKRLVIIILAILIFIALPLAAQEDLPVGCDLSALQTMIAETNDSLTTVDLDTALVLLHDLDNAISTTRAACSGLAFTSDEYGLQPVLGPIDLADGIWKLTFATEGFGAGQTTTLSGDCGEDRYHLFNYMSGEADQGGQVLMTTSNACSFLFALENADEPWTLAFELIKQA